VLQVTEDEFASHRQVSGRLTANVIVSLDRTALRGALPLREGAFEMGSRRITIVHVIRRATTCTIQVRDTRVESLFARPTYRRFSYALWNRSRREAVAASQSASSGATSLGFIGLSAPEATSGFILEEISLHFPPRGQPGMNAFVLDPSWVAEAELAILEKVPAGSVERTVVIDRFKMQP
jgi:hypothetical protein